MKNIELLAPAGSYEALVAAIENGADAIYLGGNEFSARAFATNFDRKELEKAVNYSHLRNVKIYVTVNTLYSDDQFLQLHDYLVFLAKINVDALIIQDMGLLNYVLEHFPNFEIHLSTQASIHDLPGVEFFKNKGIKRIVLARENSLDEIKSICNQTDLDIEVFVHGALCMSYSGQCLMSSMIAKRSGNKGACGQPCRLAYQLEKDDQILNQKPLYLLSPRDLCTIESIDLLIEAGITSFKIEGRMKRPEYVAIVVKQYRDAIDAYLNKKQLNDIDQRILKMKKMFNRNFTGGYLLKDRQFMARDLPGNQGIKVAKVIGYNKAKKLVKLQLTDQLKQGDRINFVDLELTRTITKLYHQRKLVNQAKNGDIVEIELNQIPKLQSFAYKLYDIDLIQEAKASYQEEKRKNEIIMEFTGKINTAPSLTIKYQDHVVSTVSNLIIEPAKKQPLDKKRIEKQLAKLGNTVFKAKEITVDFPQNGFFSITEINEMRRIAISLLIEQINYQDTINYPEFNEKSHHLTKEIKGIDVRVFNLQQLEALITCKIHHYYFPISNQLEAAINLAQKYHKKIIPFTGFLTPVNALTEFKNSNLYNLVDTIMVPNFDGLELFKDKKCILDFNFNLYNSYALQYFQNYPCILSLEITKKMINQLNDVKQDIILTVYGKTINMHLKHCLISDCYFNEKRPGCNLCKNGKFKLVDRKGEKFTIMSDEYCNNLLFNSHYLYIDHVDHLDVDYLLLSFSDETKEECLAVFLDYVNIINNKPRQNYLKSKITNGYFYD